MGTFCYVGAPGRILLRLSTRRHSSRARHRLAPMPAGMGPAPAFESYTQGIPYLAPARTRKQKKLAKASFFCFCAPGRIRTYGARRRLVYSQLQLTTLPPTRCRTIIRYTFFALLSTKYLRSRITAQYNRSPQEF